MCRPMILVMYQHPQVLLSRAVLNPFSIHPLLVLGTATTQLQDLALCLVELHEVHTGPPLFSQGPSGWQSLPSSLLTVSHNLVPSTNLQRVHTIPLSMSPAMMVNRPGPNPSGTSLVTGLYSDINPLTVILCMSYLAWHRANFLSTE